MKYIALIEPGDREAAEDWVEAMLECGDPLPAASSLADLRSEHPEWRD